MRTAWLCLVVGLLCEMIALDVFVWLGEAAYRQPRTVAEAAELPLTYACLVLAGPLAMVAVSCAVLLFFRRTRRWVACSCSVLFCLPPLVVAALCTHVLGCIRGWW